MKMEDVLDDLVGRFLLQLKYSDRRTTERVIFHIEEAHWFYEDYYRKKFKLPYINLRDFTVQIVQHAKLASSTEEVDQEFRKFIKYKKTVPVFGGLIFNSFLDKILLVRGYGGKNSFTFPRGKINKSETPVECAVREVVEEVGYNIQHKMLKSVCVDMSTKAKESKLYVVLNVPERTQFLTQTRNEIKEIKWVSLASICRGKEEALSYVRIYYKDIKKALDAVSALKVPLDRGRIMEAMEASTPKGPSKPQSNPMRRVSC